MVLRIGHRGACGYGPENTLLSFKKALELNVDIIELDVCLCKTKEVIVIHDSKVDRTTNGKGYVAKKTFNELRKLDAGKGEKIPLLTEVLDLVNRKAKVNIEIKGKGIAKSVFGIIEKYVKDKGWQYENFLVSSFDYDELLDFYNLNPKVKTSVLFEKSVKKAMGFTEKVNAYSINPSFRLATKKFIENAHKKGLKVFVWTVNKRKNIEKLKQLGVDGIFSNYPDRI